MRFTRICLLEQVDSGEKWGRTNRINATTIANATQGLANHLRKVHGVPQEGRLHRVAIACDSRCSQSMLFPPRHGRQDHPVAEAILVFRCEGGVPYLWRSRDYEVTALAPERSMCVLPGLHVAQGVLQPRRVRNSFQNGGRGW